jgi:HAD superfamily hydrolase (TIGR01484 family)
MQPLTDADLQLMADIRFVLTDIDDTLTVDGRLPAVAFNALERLYQSGIHPIPITGRPAGWCDHIARMWPVAAVVGENGAFYFRYDRGRRKMVRAYWVPDSERAAHRRRLDRIGKAVLDRIPGCRISADQAYRESDLAIDFCEDVPRLPPSAVDEIVACFTAAGATAKVSSIHVNGWFGNHDKLTMTRQLFVREFDRDLPALRHEVVFCGDAPNDEPMFAYFPYSIGVANVAAHRDRMVHLPRWVTGAAGGHGFAELVDRLLSVRGQPAI